MLVVPFSGIVDTPLGLEHGPLYLGEISSASYQRQNNFYEIIFLTMPLVK
jgi:hypothetical protein